jgi:hypothetical protein
LIDNVARPELKGGGGVAPIVQDLELARQSGIDGSEQVVVIGRPPLPLPLTDRNELDTDVDIAFRVMVASDP